MPGFLRGLSLCFARLRVSSAGREPDTWASLDVSRQARTNTNCIYHMSSAAICLCIFAWIRASGSHTLREHVASFPMAQEPQLDVVHQFRPGPLLDSDSNLYTPTSHWFQLSWQQIWSVPLGVSIDLLGPKVIDYGLDHLN